MSSTFPATKEAKGEAPSTLKTYVFKNLRDAIVGGRYKPGQRLNESQLAREFHISRIPIREALMQLCEHGLVMNHQRRGMFVTALSEEDVQRINSLRLILETEALKLCAANMTKAVAQRLKQLVDQMENWDPGADIDRLEDLLLLVRRRVHEGRHQIGERPGRSHAFDRRKQFVWRLRQELYRLDRLTLEMDKAGLDLVG